MNSDPIKPALVRLIGFEEADALITKASRYTNYPNVIKGFVKMPASPGLEGASLAIIEDQDLAYALGLDARPNPGMYTYALLTLAARADIGVLDRVAMILSEIDSASRHLAAIRRGAIRHAAMDRSMPPASASQVTHPDAPQRISEVKAWLKMHGEAELNALEPYYKQKTAARAAAVRALGEIATPEALEVLGQYASEKYPDKILDELHRAWGRFDRRAFASRMFRQAPWRLDLGFGSSIEGIGAVEGLTSLNVGFRGSADLSPLTECTKLTSLWVAAPYEPGLLSVEPLLGLTELTELHLTHMTHNADLAQLAALPVRRLRLELDGADCSFLQEMSRLERLLLSGAVPGETTNDVIVALVRKGVRVMAYTHETEWVGGLRECAEKEADVFFVETNGYIGFVNDESTLDAVKQHLFSNIVP